MVDFYGHKDMCVSGLKLQLWNSARTNPMPDQSEISRLLTVETRRRVSMKGDQTTRTQDLSSKSKPLPCQPQSFSFKLKMENGRGLISRKILAGITFVESRRIPLQIRLASMQAMTTPAFAYLNAAHYSS